MAVERLSRCSAQVAEGGRSVRFHQCSRQAVVTEEGQPWCRQHAPSLIKQRLEESLRRWRTEQEARLFPYHERDRLRIQNKELLEALEVVLIHIEELGDAWSRGALSERDGKGGIRSNRNADCACHIRAAIAKANADETKG